MTQPIYSPAVLTASAVSGHDAPPRSGARLVAEDGRPLPLESTTLASEAGGGLARTVLRQRFRNTESVPLEVVYLVPLPADGAVSGYSFELDGVVTRGVVEKTEVARELYEQALLEGKSAALLEEERSGLFQQRLGNVPPGQHLDVSVVIDQPLSWVDHGWELRFPTVVAPRYHHDESEAGSVVPVALGPNDDSVDVPATHDVNLVIRDELTQAPSSPSHALETERVEGETRARVQAARLDRDVVIRWSVAREWPAVRLETARLAPGHARGQAQYGLLTLTPPRRATGPVARDLIVLLDTSGSMAGEPLAQAVRLVSALVESLGDDDRLELIEFGSVASRFTAAPLPATRKLRAAALRWLSALRAGGGTEMKSGIDAALTSLREDALRQVVLVTDGLIGFEQEILQELTRRLPARCRLHTVGIGHAVNRSLLQPAARAGRGAEVIVAPGEDVEPACARLLERLAEPLIVNLRITGSALAKPPGSLPDLHSGSPVLVPLVLRPEGGSLEIAGDSREARYGERLEVEPREPESGAARVTALYARECVQQLELELSAENLDVDEGDSAIEALGIDFQIATRLTSWVAVSDARSVDPTRSTRRIEQPHLLPAGVSAEGLGLRSVLAMAPMVGASKPSPPASGELRLRMSIDSPPVALAPAPPSPAAAHRMSFGISIPFGSKGAAGDGTAGAEGPSRTEPSPLRGTIRLKNRKRMVIAITAHHAFDWRRPKTVKVTLEDQEVELEVDDEHSTASGTVESGRSARLVLKLSGSLPGKPLSVQLPGAPGKAPLVIELA